MPTINDLVSYDQEDGTVEIISHSYHDNTLQCSFATDSTTGTLAVQARYHKDADPEIVYEADGTTALVIDLTSLKTFQLKEKWVYSLIFTPTGVDATYTPILASGRFLGE